jgi:type II secretory pathway pseudopilin PulG
VRATPRGGFLLLEALIGLAIIGLVAIGLLAATASQVRTADKASVLLVAGALAQDRLTALQILDQEQLRDPPDSLLVGVFPAPFDEYAWDAEVVEAEDEYDLFAIRLEVKGRGEVYPLETLLHRPPLLVSSLPQGGQGRGGQGGGGAGRGGGRGGDGQGGVGRGGPGGGGFPPGAGPGTGPGGRGRAGTQGRGAGAGGRGGGATRGGRAAPPPPPRGGGL